MSSSSRLSSLDGLRGAAALIVVVHHCLLVSPTMAAVYYGGEGPDSLLGQLLAYSPLHLAWGGAEAVAVFFVLSGFVLVRATQSARFEWFSYFPSRLVRLYVPVAAAIAFAALVILLPHGDTTSSPWLVRDSGYPLADMMRDLSLVGGTSGVLSPLWSLRWEVIFSLLLPVAAYCLRALPAWALGVVSIGLSAVGAATDVAALQYLPIFGVGVAIAGEWDRVGAMIRRLSHRASVVLWPLVLTAMVLLLSASWTLTPLLGRGGAARTAQVPILMGAAVLVIAAVHCEWLRRILSWRPLLWLGAVSFSLYLVHEPIVILFAHATDAALPTLAFAVPVALVAAWAFHHIVERPSHRLSQGVRARASDAAARAGEPTPEAPLADMSDVVRDHAAVASLAHWVR